ncbi:MAG: high-affinity branched-chain amino acid ABC transporter permease LivM [Hyphomicrobiales bacterium]|nr:high-affinity branched-chain amino acid ABC transporter permease LivM [Hyphomicrobiales bacterium]
MLLGPRPWLLASAVGAVVAGRLALHLLYWWPGDPGTRMIRFALAAVLPLIPVAPAWKLTGETHKVIFLVIALYGFEAVLLVLRYAGDARGQSDRWPNMAKRLSAIRAKAEGWLGVALVAFACALPFLPFTDRYILDVSIMVLTYIMLGWGLNIVVGLAGLLDLGYVAFYAVGAYSYALLATHFDLSFWVALPLAGALAGLWGIILGFPVLRLRGDYLAIVTLAFGEMIRIILINWYSLTNGPDGISRIPRPSFFGLELTRRGEPSFHDFFNLPYSPIHRIIYLYYIILVLALLTNVVTNRLRKLPVGRAWEALREDEIACRSLGINTRNTKLTAFAIGAMFGGFAGSFFATRQGFISPESFTFIESAIILAIVVLGGMGSQIGVVIAAVVMIGGFELFRELEEYRMMMFGLGMVAIMVWRPRGLIATREPSVYLKEKKAISGEFVQEGEG